MELERKLKLALDESRLLILGAQVLFGFQFQGVFQARFASLPWFAQAMQAAGLLLLLAAVSLLIAPSMQHQIAYRGETRRAALEDATRYADVSLFPLTLGLGASAFVVFQFFGGATAGLVAGTIFVAVGLGLLYGLGFALKRGKKRSHLPKEEAETPLKVKIEQLLTEARVIIPGGQALLGFQFVATLTDAFAALPGSVQLVHAVALCLVALAVMLLMTPAALHRIAYGGEDDLQFFRIGSRFVTTAAAPLALGISADVYVVFAKITGNGPAAFMAGSLSAVSVLGLWYLYPLWKRQSIRRVQNG
jgi:hypothetical protein